MKEKAILIKESRFTFYILTIGIAFSFMMYMYLVNSTVRNAVARQSAEAKVLDLRNDVSDLEYRYMASLNSVTLDSAKSLGLSEPVQKVFIMKDSSNSSSGQALSFNKN